MDLLEEALEEEARSSGRRFSPEKRLIQRSNMVSFISKIEALWEKVIPLNRSGDDLLSDDFNSDDIPTLEARITVSPAPAPTPNPDSIPNLTFLLAFAPALPTKPLLKSILKRKRQVEVTILSDDDDNRLDLDDGGKELAEDGDYRPGNRLLIRRGNRGQFKKARTE
ncbi:hypothetical protein BGZ57DRAFT_860653 [Hyaloscypha finlandica]|nr:hypothetical protein BGZ57DRAFT_860653 [Hyaloscypha finlandica]